MNDGFLSQEEVDMLLNSAATGNSGDVPEEPSGEEQPGMQTEGITEEEKDILGEVGNISMSTAATTLSTLISHPVSITTPVVTWVPFNQLTHNLSVPKVVTRVRFESGIRGENVLLIDAPDASIIADLMMGGDGSNPQNELGEMELSAVSEAMNQMIGSASTAISQMLGKSINIAPPTITLWEEEADVATDVIEDEEYVARIGFRLTVGSLIDSEIMQVYTRETIDDIIGSMMGTLAEDEPEPAAAPPVPPAPDPQAVQSDSDPDPAPAVPPQEEQVASSTGPTRREAPRTDHVINEDPVYEEPVSIQKPVLQQFEQQDGQNVPRNIDLIMDVPLEVSVVLGKTKKTIQEILALSRGSVVELNKFAEEPLHVFVNDKLIAKGEVVVINENFGIRITNILDVQKRVDTFK